jgi:hypothetical protein
VVSSVKLKMKVVVHRRDEQRGDDEAQRAGARPAVAPAEVLAGDHEADRDA